MLARRLLTRSRTLHLRVRGPAKSQSSMVQSLQSEQEKYLMANYTMAKKNLSLKPWLENGKASLASKYQQLQEMKTTYQEKQRKLEIHLQKWNLQAAVTHVETELNGAEAESEAQVERFLEGTVSLNSFLETFQSSRKVVHLRKCQLEKLQEAFLRDRRIQHPLQARLNMTRVCRAPVSQHLAAPRAYRLTPAFLIPSENVAPFPLLSAPPYRILPPLGTQADQYQVSQPRTRSLNLPHRLVAYIPLLSPKPYKSNYADKRYQLPHQ
uniref:Vacuolar protein sorting-associated protein 37D isoform X2 n=1 Tax=Geotrypetes seraphini TaxID=260995 RepID=A0A6P8P979_GEOSA|nr:vacuolar protein sorting-associated protein 37D isoform X2 [Geotrypetes seraphini]